MNEVSLINKKSCPEDSFLLLFFINQIQKLLFI